MTITQRDLFEKLGAAPTKGRLSKDVATLVGSTLLSSYPQLTMAAAKTLAQHLSAVSKANPAKSAQAAIMDIGRLFDVAPMDFHGPEGMYVAVREGLPLASFIAEAKRSSHMGGALLGGKDLGGALLGGKDLGGALLEGGGLIEGGGLLEGGSFLSFGRSHMLQMPHAPVSTRPVGGDGYGGMVIAGSFVGGKGYAKGDVKRAKAKIAAAANEIGEARTDTKKVAVKRSIFDAFK